METRKKLGCPVRAAVQWKGIVVTPASVHLLPPHYVTVCSPWFPKLVGSFSRRIGLSCILNGDTGPWGDGEPWKPERPFLFTLHSSAYKILQKMGGMASWAEPGRSELHTQALEGLPDTFHTGRLALACRDRRWPRVHQDTHLSDCVAGVFY